MMANYIERLLEGARNTLKGNWNGNYTIPSPTLYPHQWSWDSAFIAMGNSYFNIGRAIRELEFLFDAQWSNWMVPHIVFNEKEKITAYEGYRSQFNELFPTLEGINPGWVSKPHAFQFTCTELSFIITFSLTTR
jgi:Mannosylglycerate hydrolase MGH1-like glycoside hydrolase domain